MIHVDEIAAKIARFYEQIRNIVDYQEEHLLRKSSILRALQRELFLRSSDDRAFAESLIREIIRSGHLPNDRIPETRIAEVGQSLDTLSILLQRIATNPSITQRQELSQWITRLTACSIEETLDPPIKDRLMAATMFRALNDRLVIKGEEVTQNDRVAQLFIATQKALLKVDPDQLAYRFLRFMYPYWDNPTPEQLEGIAGHLEELKLSVYAYTHDPLGGPFFQFCNHYNTVFLLLGDVLWGGIKQSAEPIEVLDDPSKLNIQIEAAYHKRFSQQKRRLRRLAFFSIISLFISKVLIALAIEIPIDLVLLNNFSITTTILNILFPPLLMLLIILMIRLPSKRNLPLVLEEVQSVVFQEHAKEHLMVIPKEKSKAIKRVINACYALLSILVLAGVTKLLFIAQFSVASSVVFVLFTSIVAATGVKVQNRSKELSLEKERASLRWFLSDLLSMPFVTIGRITMAGLSKFRFLVIIVNLVDTPLIVFLRFLENFNAFLRTKKQEVH